MRAESRRSACPVVGAGREAVARAFAAEGLSVCVTRRPRSLAELEPLVEEFREDGGEAHAFGGEARNRPR